jgi:hypothetical protein
LAFTASSVQRKLLVPEYVAESAALEVMVK